MLHDRYRYGYRYRYYNDLPSRCQASNEPGHGYEERKRVET